MSAEQLLALLRDGGRVVSSNDLSAEALVLARARDHMWVDSDHFGYVYLPEGVKTSREAAR